MNVRSLTADELDREYVRHRERLSTESWCFACHEAWPCTVAMLIATVDAERARLQSIGAEAARLRLALVAARADNDKGAWCFTKETDALIAEALAS